MEKFMEAKMSFRFFERLDEFLSYLIENNCHFEMEKRQNGVSLFVYEAWVGIEEPIEFYFVNNELKWFEFIKRVYLKGK